MTPTNFTLKTPQTDSLLKPVFEADKTRNIFKVSQAILHCLKKHTHLSLQEIESSLRERKSWTYLIARNRNSSINSNIIFKLPNGTKMKYYLFVSTKNRKDALNELREESKSYCDNFVKLKYTGFMMRQNPSIGFEKCFNSGNIELHDLGVIDFIERRGGKDLL